MARKRIMEGQLVVELANVLAGPSVGQFLGELGARVVKVESPVTNGDVTRSWKLKSEGKGEQVTAYFSSCNLGKQSMALDLTKEDGKKVVHELAKKADCVLASFKPGDAKKLGVDADTLRALNPRLIYAEITGYGLDDPRTGYDAVIQAESGFQFMNGSPESDPCKMPVALVDVITAHQLKEAVLIELWRREQTGVGSQVNVSLMASAVSALVNQAMGYLKEGAIPKRMGSDHPTIVPYGTIFRTKDPEEMITLGVGSDSQFRSLCKLLEKENLGHSDSKFAQNIGRCAHRDELKQLLATEFAKWDRSSVLVELGKAKIPAGAINNMATTFSLPQAQELVVYDGKSFGRKDHLQCGPFNGKQPIGLRQIAFKGSPEGLDAAERREFSPPPEFGQHTDEILKEILGMSQEQIATLRASQVIH